MTPHTFCRLTEFCIRCGESRTMAFERRIACHTGDTIVSFVQRKALRDGLALFQAIHSRPPSS